MDMFILEATKEKGMGTQTHPLNIYYRGSLDTCNYTCSYCAFGRKSSLLPIGKDRIAWERFIARIEGSPEIAVRIFLLPYGEAMIHDYYVEGVLRLAQLPQVTGICCQTNLSFSVNHFLEAVRECQVPTGKLKFWASFHPEMVKPDVFVRKVHQLWEQGIEVGVGVVGNPVNLEIIRRLRSELDCGIYLFINAMEGLKRPLTYTEKKEFEEIDNLFLYDLSNFEAAPTFCRGGKDAFFVDAKGTVYACPRSRTALGDFYREESIDTSEKQIENKLSVSGQQVICRKKVCDCYIAYSNLPGTPLARLMGNGLFWRIPEKKKVSAIFFDIDGTLLLANGMLPERYITALRHFAAKIPLFIATSLPVSYAKQRLGHYFSLFKGGVFASGAHVMLEERNEYIFIEDPSMAEDVLEHLPEMETYRIRRYDAEDTPFKYSITAPTIAKAADLAFSLSEKEYKVCHERRLVTLVDRKAGKDSGLLRICQLEGLNPHEVLAVGNTMQDAPMMSVAGHSCAVLDAEEELKLFSDVVLNPDMLPAFFSAMSKKQDNRTKI